MNSPGKMSTPLFDVLQRNLAVPDEDRCCTVSPVTGRRKSTVAQMDKALSRVRELLDSGQCRLIKEACLQVSSDEGVSCASLLQKYSRCSHGG